MHLLVTGHRSPAPRQRSPFWGQAWDEPVQRRRARKCKRRAMAYIGPGQELLEKHGRVVCCTRHKQNRPCGDAYWPLHVCCTEMNYSCSCPVNACALTRVGRGPACDERKPAGSHCRGEITENRAIARGKKQQTQAIDRHATKPDLALGWWLCWARSASSGLGASHASRWPRLPIQQKLELGERAEHEGAGTFFALAGPRRGCGRRCRAMTLLGGALASSAVAESSAPPHAAPRHDGSSGQKASRIIRAVAENTMPAGVRSIARHAGAPPGGVARRRIADGVSGMGGLAGVRFRCFCF